MPGEESPGARSGAGQLQKMPSRASIASTPPTSTPCCSSSSSVSSVGAGVEGQTPQGETFTSGASRSQTIHHPAVTNSNASPQGSISSSGGSRSRVIHRPAVPTSEALRITSPQVGRASLENAYPNADALSQSSQAVWFLHNLNTRIPNLNADIFLTGLLPSSPESTPTTSSRCSSSVSSGRSGVNSMSSVSFSSPLATTSLVSSACSTVPSTASHHQMHHTVCSTVTSPTPHHQHNRPISSTVSSVPLHHQPNRAISSAVTSVTPHNQHIVGVTITTAAPHHQESRTVCSSSPSAAPCHHQPRNVCSSVGSPSLVGSRSPSRHLRPTPPPTRGLSPRTLRTSPHLSEHSSRRLERSGGSNSSNSSSSSSYSQTLEQRRAAHISHLALTYLNSLDSVLPPCLHSPPPSYDQLCNPNALPSYHEATRSGGSGGSSKQQRRAGEHQWRPIYYLPSSAAEQPPPTSDPLLQEGDRGQRAGATSISSLAGEPSDSEGGFSTIMDAIPHEHPRDPRAAPVPVTFLSAWPFRRLRPPNSPPPSLRSPCLASVCNKALVRKELNRRWPFISGAKEDADCPGLLQVQCSAHLTVAHLPDITRPPDVEGITGDLEDLPREAVATLSLNDLPANGSPSNNAVDLESGAVTTRVVFYLCGKCVGYDSFDMDSVRAHIEFDCPGPRQHHAELYLVLRAVLFVAVVIGIFLWLPYLRL